MIITYMHFNQYETFHYIAKYHIKIQHLSHLLKLLKIMIYTWTGDGIWVLLLHVAVNVLHTDSNSNWLYLDSNCTPIQIKSLHRNNAV